jgi:hypothetical protein
VRAAAIYFSVKLTAPEPLTVPHGVSNLAPSPPSRFHLPGHLGQRLRRAIAQPPEQLGVAGVVHPDPSFTHEVAVEALDFEVLSIGWAVGNDRNRSSCTARTFCRNGMHNSSSLI